MTCDLEGGGGCIDHRMKLICIYARKSGRINVLVFHSLVSLFAFCICASEQEACLFLEEKEGLDMLLAFIFIYFFYAIMCFTPHPPGSD